MKTTTTHLTGKNFQKAHLALCARRKMGAVAHRYDKKAIVDSVLIAIGMLLGALLLGTALVLLRKNPKHKGHKACHYREQSEIS